VLMALPAMAIRAATCEQGENATWIHVRAWLD
jgi:hypothetical protein